MELIIDLQIAEEGDDHPPPSEIEHWVGRALTAADYSKDSAELTVRLVDREEIRELNLQYRGKNKATNVLSFPAELPEALADELNLLGDMVICSAVVADEALEQKKPLPHHWAHMLVHGSLHLLGYDHIDDGEAEAMEALETAILAGGGINDPYTVQESQG